MAVIIINNLLSQNFIDSYILKNEIKFSANGSPVETRYEIYDAYGNIVKKGVGSKVNCSNLLRGVYYINFDNVNEKFIKN